MEEAPGGRPLEVGDPTEYSMQVVEASFLAAFDATRSRTQHEAIRADSCRERKRRPIDIRSSGRLE
jgi:hypothetical protein